MAEPPVPPEPITAAALNLTSDGVVREVIAVVLTVGFVAFCLLTLFLFVGNQSNQALHDILIAAAGALSASFSTITGVYFGAKSQQASASQTLKLVQAQQAFRRAPDAKGD